MFRTGSQQKLRSWRWQRKWSLNSALDGNSMSEWRGQFAVSAKCLPRKELYSQGVNSSTNPGIKMVGWCWSGKAITLLKLTSKRTRLRAQTHNTLCIWAREWRLQSSQAVKKGRSVRNGDWQKTFTEHKVAWRTGRQIWAFLEGFRGSQSFTTRRLMLTCCCYGYFLKTIFEKIPGCLS